MKTLFVGLALGMTACWVAPAAAASPNMGRQYVACLAQTRPSEVRALLHAADESTAAGRYQTLTNDQRCLTRVFDDRPFQAADLAFSIGVLRGDLAEQALLAMASQVAALPALPLQQKAYLRPWAAATGRNATVDEMGACMADTDPAAIYSLIRTQPGSTEENAAMAAISPALTKCLTAGTRLEADRRALRAALADALYQRVSNPGLSVAQNAETPK
jgi:hypothetical protein